MLNLSGERKVIKQQDCVQGEVLKAVVFIKVSKPCKFYLPKPRPSQMKQKSEPKEEMKYKKLIARVPSSQCLQTV